jgi:hypothetical protein
MLSHGGDLPAISPPLEEARQVAPDNRAGADRPSMARELRSGVVRAPGNSNISTDVHSENLCLRRA